MDFRLKKILLGAIVLVSAEAAGLANAQEISSATPLPSNVPSPHQIVAGAPAGAKAVPLPPAGFNVLTASPAERTRYAIPPAPDPNAAPELYEKWKKAVAVPMSAARPNAPTPVLTQTRTSHGPMKKAAGSLTPSVAPKNGLSNGVLYTYSYNWSGTVVSNAQAPFKNLGSVVGEFVVPAAHQRFGTCSGGWVYSSQWPGLDGSNTADVLQAGTEADAYCSGSSTASFYSAWIEWYPDYSIRVSAPVIHPGDLIFVQVYNVSPTSGYAYFYNYSTTEWARYQITPSKGQSLIGTSAEWVVERPSVNNAFTQLMNYIDVTMPYGAAWNHLQNSPTYYYAGSNPPAGNLEVVTMVDNNGQPISKAYPASTAFLWFINSGSSQF